MTERSLDMNRLGDIAPVQRSTYDGEAPYRPYEAGAGEAPPFLPIGGDEYQVRMTASTHNADGLLQHSSAEALANSRRLRAKVEAGTPPLYYLEEAEGAEALIVTYGITAGAAREAVEMLKAEGVPVSLLVARTLVPVPDAYYAILARYRRGEEASRVPVVFAEENLRGQLASIMFGERLPDGVRVVGDIGYMVKPEEIVQEVLR